MIAFLISETLKIILLLFGMIFVLSVLRSFLPHDQIKTWLGRRKFAAHIFASLFGALTPFCSCSSIPIFLSFIKVQIPLGVAFSFLITSPLINEYLAVLMIRYFGWKITLLYILSGMTLGILGGWILGAMKLEKHLTTDVVGLHAHEEESKEKTLTFQARIKFAFNEALNTVGKMWLWILVGVALGGLIQNYIPQESIEQVLKATGWFSVPLAVFIGAPIYGNCAAIVPIAVALFQKGIPLGTALAFMMAVSALSIPEAVILKRAMTFKLLMIFFSIVMAGIILTGYLFNLLHQIFY